MISNTKSKAVAAIVVAALAAKPSSATATATATDSTNARNLIHQASTYGFKQTSDKDNTHDASIVFGQDENGEPAASFVIDQEPTQLWEDAQDGTEGNEGCGDQCVDNPAFVSMMGLPCHGHSYFECGMFVQVGFTEEQVEELISNCPCSCNACPTPVPSSVPTSSPMTSRPSAAPVSSSPTSKPTAAPSTKVPTNTPTTLRPTAMPTLRPSRTPTVPPGTSSPTKTPTSTAPTSSPVQEMSTTTRIQPVDESDETACPSGYSGLIGTVDCKGAVHCTKGVKSFGPIPCLSGPDGDLLFDLKSQKCVVPSGDFICQQLPQIHVEEEKVSIDVAESNGNNDTPSEDQAALSIDSIPEKESPTSSPTTTKSKEQPTSNKVTAIQETTSTSEQTLSESVPNRPESKSEEEQNIFRSLSLKELIIVSVGGGCLVLFIVLSVFFAVRRNWRKRSAQQEESKNNRGERQHNAGKSSSSTIDSEDATPTLEYYTYINKAMRNNRAVTNFTASKQTWSTKREFLAENRSQKSSSTASEESSRQREDDTMDAQENGTVTSSMRDGDDETVDADVTVATGDEGAYNGSKA